MSLWWARKEQLDNDQMALIEGLSLSQNHLILGPPGSGKDQCASAPRPICKKPRATKCIGSYLYTVPYGIREDRVL